MIQGVLWVGKPPMKTRALQFQCADPAVTAEVRRVVLNLVFDPAFREASAFVQCDSPEYLMVEFWGSRTAAQALCDAAAAELGRELHAFDGALRDQPRLLGLA